tara:strand:- start:68 stop:1666 length:1599 start_codon:yes stop_codon:yes gene_type:complete
MFIHRAKKKVKDKTYYSVLLMHNYRENGKIKHRTIMNLSKWNEDKINALERVIKGEKGITPEQVILSQGKGIGAIWAFKKLADQLGLSQALGATRKAKIMLLLIIARIMTQGSRRQAFNWAKTQEVAIVFGIQDLTQNELYEALDQLYERQEEIEKNLYVSRYGEKTPSLYLYDVTSSYLEGEQNECGNWGYNRDGKKGTRQIVIGLLMADDGIPIAVEVFEGNTCDTRTLQSQIQKLSNRFKVSKVVLVGDKGMIKGPQIELIDHAGYEYITTITKGQIHTLLNNGTIQMELFEDALVEVKDEGIRYILRRNPVRAQDIGDNRKRKIESVQDLIKKENELLTEKPGRKIETSLKVIHKKIDRLKLNKIIHMDASESRTIRIKIDKIELQNASKLDGCYVVKTNCMAAEKSTKVVHDAYKQLAKVESAFRTIKTTCLEVRPIYVRKESRTKGHVFLTMLSFILVNEFESKTSFDPETRKENIDLLNQIQTVKVSILGETVKKMPETSPELKQLLARLNITLPSKSLLNKRAV